MEIRRQEGLRPARFVAGAVVVTAIVTAIVAAAGIDVSALRDFERDTIMLRQPYTEGDRYFDPSGHALWLSSDLFVWDSVRSFDLPLWNRLQGGGYSSLNAIHEGVWHPLRWLTALTPRRSAPTTLIVLILAAAFTGMYLLVRFEFGFSIAAATLAAAAFAFSGVLISMVHFSGAILPLAHIPWIVFFLRRSSMAGLVISLALLFLSGHPLLEACAAMAVGGIAIAGAASSRSSRPVILGTIGGFAGVLIAAPAWLPALLTRSDLWTYKTQTTEGTSYFAYGLLEWAAATQAMVIDVFTKDGCCVDFGGFFLYVGLAALALAITGVIAVKRMRPIGILLFIAFLFSVPGPWMEPFRHLPPISFFKPWYLIGAFTFYFALCAGAGFEALWQSTTLRRVIAVALATVVMGTYLIRANEVLRPRILRAEAGGDALRFLRSDHDLFRILGLWGQTHMPNASRLTGIEDVRLLGPILTNRYHLWWQLVDPDVLSRGYPTTRVTDHLESPLVGDFNVKYILQSRLAYTGTFRLDLRERNRDTRLSPLLNDLPVVARTPWIDVRRNTRWLRPRAHFVENIIGVPSLREAVAVLARNRDLLRQTAVVETGQPVITAAFGSGTVTLSYPTERRVVMNVRSDRGGLVVLHDSYADGWNARVDGQPAEVLPVNVLSRGIVVPPGAHRVEMKYLPAVFIAGIGISAATLLGAALLMLRKTPLLMVPPIQSSALLVLVASGGSSPAGVGMRVVEAPASNTHAPERARWADVEVRAKGVARNERERAAGGKHTRLAWWNVPPGSPVIRAMNRDEPGCERASATASTCARATGRRGLTLGSAARHTIADALGLSVDQLLGHRSIRTRKAPTNEPLLRQLRQVEKLPPHARRSVLEHIDGLVAKYGSRS